MHNAIIDKISQSQEKKRPNFQVGDKITVSVRLKEGDKERVQAFKGVVISKTPKSGKGARAMFTVRKISQGIGVERIFPLHSPVIEKISIEASSKVRRSRLYYLRELKGKKARLKESARFGVDVISTEEAVAPVEVAAADEAKVEETKK